MIYFDSNTNMTDKQAIAFWIAINIICLIVFFILTIIWAFGKTKKSFYKRVISSDFESSLIPEINSMLFLLTNIVGFLILLVKLIHSML